MDWALSFEDALQVYEAWCVGRRVEIAAPSCLAPSFWIELARIAAAGGAFAFEDEVAPAKFVRGVTAGATGLVVRSGHDAPPVLVVCERGRRGAAPAFLTMGGNCSRYSGAP